VGGACGLFKSHCSPFEAEDEPDVHFFFSLSSPGYVPTDFS